ncbi:MAG: ECF transporter S component, partial [Clostridia bacterium]|nr:ECF transporter S component [Clostridia bacterium]
DMDLFSFKKSLEILNLKAFLKGSLKRMKQNHVKKIIYVGMLTALAFVLYSLEVSVGFLFPATPFLKIEFSDIPACVAALGFGPVTGVLVEFLKNVLHIFITKEPAFSGEIGNFLSGIGMILPVWFILRKNNNIKNKILAVIMSALFSAIIMAFINYFITLPLYGIADHNAKVAMILTGFIPFNLLKGALIAVVSIILFDVLKKHKTFSKL